MRERFEHQGLWWLPDKPDDRIPGTLKFDPIDGAILNLMGSLKDLEDFTNVVRPALILGLLSNGKAVTLRDCLDAGSTISFPGIPMSSFYVEMVFIGSHFEDSKDVEFEKLSVEYLHLDEWASISGFVLKIPDDHATHPIVIEYKRPNPVTVSIGESKVSLKFRGGLRASNPLVKEARIEQNAYFSIEPPQKTPLNDLLKSVYHLQHFLSLGISKPVHPVAMWGETLSGEKRRVDIYFRSLGRTGFADKIHPAKMLFTYHDLLENFEQFLNNWLRKTDVLEPVYSLHFGIMYNPEMYLHQKFLSVIQALEAYHRRAIGNLEVPKEEHERRIEELLSVAPNNHRSWLEQKLKYSNEPSLRKRLKEIFSRQPEGTHSVDGSMNSFIQKVVTTRNYLTHYDKSLKNQAAGGEELHRIVQKLKSLLETCFLHEIGFGNERINELLSRRP